MNANNNNETGLAAIPERLAQHLKQSLPIDITQARAAVKMLMDDGLVRPAADVWDGGFREASKRCGQFDRQPWGNPYRRTGEGND